MAVSHPVTVPTCPCSPPLSPAVQQSPAWSSSAPLGSRVALLLFQAMGKGWHLQLSWGWLSTHQKRGRSGAKRRSRTSPAKGKDIRVVARSFPCFPASFMRSDRQEKGGLIPFKPPTGTKTPPSNILWGYHSPLGDLAH